MRKHSKSWIGLWALGCSALNGGCVDAVTEGVAAGLNAGIAAVVENLIATAAEGIVAGE